MSCASLEALCNEILYGMLGLLTVRALSDQYRQASGSTRGLADFHDAVLGAGALPLAVLERSVLAHARQESKR